MFCIHCGKTIREDSVFCVYCGAPVNQAPAVEPTLPVAPKSQPRVQKVAEDATATYAQKAASGDKKGASRNVVTTVIIIFLCLILVATLVLLYPTIIDLLEQNKEKDEEAKKGDSTSQVQKDDDEEEAENRDALSQSNPYYDCYRAHDEYVLPHSSSQYLNSSELAELSEQELQIALQEIYARHGQRFSDRDLQAYFDLRGWYASSASPSPLNTYETANEILLQVYIAQQDGSFYRSGNPYVDLFAGTDAFAVPNSNNRYLNAADLKNLTAEQLVVARNEIYARHGYVFSDTDLQEYFCSKSWYVPTGTAVSDSTLNEYENNNVKLIQIYERKLDGVTFSADNPYMDYYSVTTSYIYPSSDSQLLIEQTMYDYTLTEEKCILGRNEIFARHGYTFSNEELLEYFLQQPWYYPSSPIGDTDAIHLSDIERKNAEHLQAVERAFDEVPDVSSLNKSKTYTVSYDKVTLTLPAYWKDYTKKQVKDSQLYFHDVYSTNLYGSLSSEFGHVCNFNLVPVSEYSGPEDIFRRLGILTDAEGNQWYITVYTPSDVRHCMVVSALYSQMTTDLNSIQITPAEGYTYTPY